MSASARGAPQWNTTSARATAPASARADPSARVGPSSSSVTSTPGADSSPCTAGTVYAVQPAHRPREPPLRRPGVLEVELVEHALACLTQQRAGVGGAE